MFSIAPEKFPESNISSTETPPDGKGKKRAFSSPKEKEAKKVKDNSPIMPEVTEEYIQHLMVNPEMKTVLETMLKISNDTSNRTGDNIKKDMLDAIGLSEGRVTNKIDTMSKELTEVKNNAEQTNKHVASIDSRVTALESNSSRNGGREITKIFHSILEREINEVICNVAVFNVPVGKNAEWVRDQALLVDVPEDLKTDIKEAKIFKAGDARERNGKKSITYHIKLSTVRARSQFCAAVNNKHSGCNWDQALPKAYRSIWKTYKFISWLIRSVDRDLTTQTEWKDQDAVLYWKVKGKGKEEPRFIFATFTPKVKEAGAHSSPTFDPKHNSYTLCHQESNNLIIKVCSTIIWTGKTFPTILEAGTALLEPLEELDKPLMNNRVSIIDNHRTKIAFDNPQDANGFYKKYKSRKIVSDDWNWALLEPPTTTTPMEN
jgi:hypothetical protein